MRLILTRLAVCAAMTLPAGFAAQAETQTYFNPMNGGKRLDWCVDWGTGCGKQAADQFCAQKGFSNSTSFNEAVDIGGFAPTRLIGSGAVCDQGFCDGFSHISCFKPSPVTQTFNQPHWGAQRLDWCLNWGQGCGKGAADAFCQKHGFAQAQSFAEDQNIGASQPTRLITTGAICDQGFCDGFSQITCGQ